MPTRTIVVIGGLTRRIIAEVDEMPGKGLTVTTKTYDTHTGGRGAFSAVAAYRFSHFKATNDQETPRCVCEEDEISVRLVAAVGDDDIGSIKEEIKAVGVNIDRVLPIPKTKTSMAFVVVDGASRDHSVLLCPGANHGLKPDKFGSAEKLLEECGGLRPDLLVTNCELKRSTVEQIIETATVANVPVLLNLVPEEYFFPEDLTHLTHLIVHKAEARRIFDDCPKDDDDPLEWETFAQQFLSRGVANVVVTLSS
ncbi:MAG: hypothetical protein Q9201_004518 [Fulgogasparrea decipioides]